MSENCKECPYILSLKEDVQEHKGILDKHSDEISTLKADGREYKVEINNLIQKVDSLIGTLRWVIGLMVPTLISLIALFFKK